MSGEIHSTTTIMFSLLRSLVLVLVIAGGGAAGLAGQEAPDSAQGSAGGAFPRPGDRIALRIWNEPQMTNTYTIYETGEVILPKLGSVFVGNVPAGELKDSLRAAYSVYLRNPSVEVTVLRRVGIQGEVRSPGFHYADLTTTLGDLIVQAGGITEAGNPDNIVVLRGEERIRYRKSDIRRFLVAELQSGDQVIVGRRSALARNPMGVVTGALTLAGTVFGVIVPMIRRAFESDE